ncbi:MAG: hypothetical protein ACOYD4_06775 [Solirubrobacterales bacterium]
MTAEEIMRQIDALRTAQREKAKSTWGVPEHIAAAVEPELRELNNQIHALQVQLYRLNGGKIDHAE